MAEFVKVAAGVQLDGVAVIVGTVLVRSIGNQGEIAMALDRFSKNVKTVI
jgi:hypothetical protein